MTEGGLLSNVTFKAMAAENFVCVRLFSTALGGGKEQIRKFLPGISEELHRRLCQQGNSLIVLTPDGQIVTTQYEAVDQSPELTEADVQMEEKIPGGLLQLRQVMKRFPAGGAARQETPWHFSPAHALVVSWDDNRRIVAVPSVEGRIDPSLERVLADVNLLKKFQSRYVFVKVGTEHSAPADVQASLDKVENGGLIILDIPATDKGCIGVKTDRQYVGPWSSVREIAPGPHSSASLAKLLEKHYVDLPTYVSQKSSERRLGGKNVRTGLESFDELWRRTAASVRRSWSPEVVEDMREYTRK